MRMWSFSTYVGSSKTVAAHSQQQNRPQISPQKVVHKLALWWNHYTKLL